MCIAKGYRIADMACHAKWHVFACVSDQSLLQTAGDAFSIVLKRYDKACKLLPCGAFYRLHHHHSGVKG